MDEEVKWNQRNMAGRKKNSTKEYPIQLSLKEKNRPFFITKIHELFARVSGHVRNINLITNIKHIDFIFHPSIHPFT
jgi:hypothetical protein